MQKNKFTQGLRLVLAIARKDIVDAIQNKTILGVLIGVGFMMLSSQALSLLVRGQTEHQIRNQNHEAQNTLRIGEFRNSGIQGLRKRSIIS